MVQKHVFPLTTLAQRAQEVKLLVQEIKDSLTARAGSSLPKAASDAHAKLKWLLLHTGLFCEARDQDIAELARQREQARRDPGILALETELKAIKRRLAEIGAAHDRNEAEIAASDCSSLVLHLRAARLQEECRVHLEAWNDCHMHLQSEYMRRKALQDRLDAEIRRCEGDKGVAEYYREEATRIQQKLEYLLVFLGGRRAKGQSRARGHTGGSGPRPPAQARPRAAAGSKGRRPPIAA